MNEKLAEHYGSAPWYDEVIASLDVDTGELTVELDIERSQEGRRVGLAVCKALDKADLWQREKTNNAIVPITVWSIPFG